MSVKTFYADGHRYKKLVAIPRSSCGQARGYRYKFESRDVACQRASDRGNRLSAAYNREADFELQHQLESLKKKSDMKTNKILTKINRTRESLIDLTAYRIALHERWMKNKPNQEERKKYGEVSGGPRSPSSSDIYGQYGDMCRSNAQQEVRAAKLLHFDGRTRRQAEAARILSRREPMSRLPPVAPDAILFSMAENLVIRDRSPGEQTSDYQQIPTFLSKFKVD